MKAIFKHTGSLVWFIVTVFLTIVLVVANILGQTALHSLFISFFGKRDTQVFGPGIYYESEYEDKEDAFKKSNLLNETINEEGITLLKNEGNALPLAAGSKISVFGKNSVNLAYGGSGSGAFTVTKETPTIYSALDAAGFEVNPTLKEFYESSASGSGRGGNPTLDNARSTLAGFGTGETPYSSYTTEVKNSYANYNDAALVVVTRIGGESFDLPRTMEGVEGEYSETDHYLELDKNEQDMLVAVTQSFNKVILIVNSSATLELGFLDAIADNDESLVDGMKAEDFNEKVQAAVWIGGPGYSGINALGRVLKGEVNPSGRTVDTYQRDFTKDPTYENFADNLVNKGNEYISAGSSENFGNGYDAAGKPEHFLDYEESIYVGYRYYETRGNGDDTWYNNHVVYPFGYGLSYTSFAWTVTDYSFTDGETLTWTQEADKEFTVKVNVKNTGSVAGKDVVQVYMTAPYTAGEIEKAHVVLVGFAKTPLLAAGEEKEVEVKFNAYDFASYDYNDANNNSFKGYELDAGTYTVRVMKDAHTQVASASFNVAEDITYRNDTTTGTEVVNRYEEVGKLRSEGNLAGMESLLSRNNWEGTYPVNEVKEGSDAERTISTETLKEIKSFAPNRPELAADAQMPSVADVGAADATMNLYELIEFDENDIAQKDEAGMLKVDFDDERWTEYLDILTVNEMMSLTMNGAFQTKALPSIGLLPAFVSDGPVGFVYFMAATEATNPVYRTCAYASECVIAATWNVELAYAMGESVGNEGLIGNERADGRPYTGWYAPAVNIHRTPFSGRNFEYYSEDPMISGALAAEVVEGARSKGVYTELKHFAVNDQETNRSGVCTWLTEQSLREIYLRPFEVAVKKGGSTGIMSSFNRIGTRWTGGDYRLLTEILRDEWGFRGTVITDFNTESFMDTKQMAYAGGDLNLATLPKSWNVDKNNSTDLNVLRNATKNILYTTVTSNAMNGCGEGCYLVEYYAWWEIAFVCVLIGQVVLCAVWGVFAIRGALKAAEKLGVNKK